MIKTKLVLTIIFFLALLLRLYCLASNPPSLYWDETSIGYNAYSIAETGRDEHGELFPLTRFMAFGDYKGPGYIYAAALAVKTMGLNEFSVRLPSALAGSFLVLLTFFLVVEISQYSAKISQTSARVWALLSSFFLAISPWSIQLSRGAFEANLATLFSGIGIYSFLRMVRGKSSLWAFLSAVAFSISMYTFNSHRVFVPLMIIFLGLVFIKSLAIDRKRTFIFGVALVSILFPLLLYLRTPESRLRFNEVAWINNLDIVVNSNKAIEQAGNTFFAKLFFNRRIYYAGEFARHYLDHFRFDFLFLKGDVNPRLSAMSVGELYLADFAFALLGVIAAVKCRSKAMTILVLWLLLSPVPASLARETPHALRVLNILPVPQIIVALGLTYFWEKFSRYLFLGLIFAFIYTFSVWRYLNDYYFVYPQKYESDWQYGYKQMVQYVATISGRYQNIYVTGFYGRPYIYFLFYDKYPPEKYWSSRNAQRDQFGFWEVKSFDNFNFEPNPPEGAGKSLYVDKPGTERSGKKLLKIIYDLSNHPVYTITEN